MIRIEKGRIHELTSRFQQFKIGVLGDLILDRYIWGHATRISPEAPVPIVKVNRKSSTLGGAANVMRNIASLGAKPLAYGVVGSDKAGEELKQLCQKWNIETAGIIADKNRMTTVKTRLIADHQQVVRIDEEKDHAISKDLAQTVMQHLLSDIEKNRLDAIIIEDYNKGVISSFLIEQLQSLIDLKKIPIAVDPHPQSPLEMKGAMLLTPNRVEAFNMAGKVLKPMILPLATDLDLNDVGIRLMETWSPEILLITLGSAGMALFESNCKPVHIPTAAKEVFDVSGAGDTVIATFTTTLLAGASPLEAATIANQGASIVVGKVGTIPLDINVLIESFNL